jgi:hypothetical protein
MKNMAIDILWNQYNWPQRGQGSQGFNEGTQKMNQREINKDKK